jgi:translation initiation factor IF-2
MPQTIEAIQHAKEAKSPNIVAINKMDLPEANPDRVKQQLSEYELMPEDWGGSTQFVEISGLKGEGIEDLLDILILESEMLELKANPDRNAEGKVIESKVGSGSRYCLHRSGGKGNAENRRRLCRGYLSR